MTELDDLRNSWRALDRRVDELESLQRAMRRSALQDSTRRATRRRLIGPSLEIAFAALLLILIPGGYIADHAADVLRAPLGALPALVLCVAGVAIVGFDAFKLALLAGLDFACPVVEAQRALARFWTLEVRSTQVMVVLGSALWFVYPLFAAQLFVGFDVVFGVPAGWLLANLALGVLLALAVVLAARRLGPRSRAMRAIDDAFAGREMLRLRAMVADLADLERG